MVVCLRNLVTMKFYSFVKETSQLISGVSMTIPYATVTKVVVCFCLVTSISYKFVFNSAKSFEVIGAS